MRSQRASEEDIQAVVEATDIVEIIGQHVDLRRVGGSWRGLCPFHGEKTPSFYVSAQKRIFKCFGCGAGGNVITFLMKIGNRNFPAVLRELADRSGIQVYDDEDSGMLTRLFKIHEVSDRFFRDQLKKEPSVLKYIEDRGVSPQALQEFGLGFAPRQWSSLLDHVENILGPQPDDVLEGSGLFLPRRQGDGFVDRFRARLMFPIRDVKGRVIAFGGRTLPHLTDRPEAKYMNSPETPLFEKGRQLYGLERLRREEKRQDRVILVEGYLDAIALWQAGLHPVAAPLGTGFTAEQVRLLEDRFEEVILLFDGDDAGSTAMLRAVERMVNAAVRARAVKLPEGQDPLDVLMESGRERLSRLVEEASNALRFFCEQVLLEHDLRERQGKERAWRRLKSFFQGVHPMLLSDARDGGQSELVEYLSKIFDVDEGILRTQFFGFVGKQSSEVMDFSLKTRRQGSPSLEKGVKLLIWAMGNPVWYAEIQKNCDREDFQEEVLSEMWQRVVGDGERPVSLNGLMAEGSDAMREALSNLAWREEGSEVPEEKEFATVLRDFCVERIEARLAPTTAALDDESLPEEERVRIYTERRHLMSRRRQWMLAGTKSN